MDGMISVIIPLYNRADVIEECVQSVLNQSYQNFEIVMIDDGSSDGTVDVCRKLLAGDTRIKLFEMEHAGVSAARNTGLENAGGEYVFFLDSDDVIHPLLLETLVNGMKASDAAIAGTSVVNVSEKNWGLVKGRMERDCGPGETTYQNHAETLRAVFHSTSPINLIGGVMMRRDWIGETRFCTDLFIGEDYYFVYQNLIKGAAAVFLKQRWYYCRIHANNSSWDYSFAGFWTRFVRRELVWKSEEAFGRTEYADCQKREALAVFLRCLKNGEPHGADADKMRGVMKDYKKVLLPAMGWKDRVRYYLAVYVPAAYFAAHKAKKVLKKILGK